MVGIGQYIIRCLASIAGCRRASCGSQTVTWWPTTVFSCSSSTKDASQRRSVSAAEELFFMMLLLLRRKEQHHVSGHFFLNALSMKRVENLIGYRLCYDDVAPGPVQFG